MLENKYINFLVYIVIILSLFAYEIHIYEYYTYMQLILFCLVLFVFMLMLKKEFYKKEFLSSIKKHTSILVLSVGMVLATLFALINFYENEIYTIVIVLMYIVDIMFFAFMLPIYCKYNKKFEKKLFDMIILIILSLSMFGIILFFNNGLLGYYLEYSRSCSIYFDPNFFAVISVIPCALMLKKEYKKYSIPILIISIIAVVVSGSRGTMLSLGIAIIYYLIFEFANRKIIKKIVCLILASFLFILFVSFLDSIDFFRAYQGTNGRMEMVSFALVKITESPIWGFGYGDISQILKSEGFNNASTHNSLTDFLLNYGIPCFIIYIFIIGKAFIIAINKNENKHISLLLILLFVNMNTILYSFGGVGFPSMLFTFCIGMLFYKEKNYGNKS